MLTPLRVLDLLSNKVERVPARVGEQSRIKSESNAARLRGGTLEWIIKVLCFSCGAHEVWGTEKENYKIEQYIKHRVFSNNKTCVGATWATIKNYFLVHYFLISIPLIYGDKSTKNFSIPSKHLFTMNYLDDAHCDDEEQRHDLGVGENILNQSAPLYISTVYEDQNAWGKRRNNLNKFWNQLFGYQNT